MGGVVTPEDRAEHVILLLTWGMWMPGREIVLRVLTRAIAEAVREGIEDYKERTHGLEQAR